MSFEKVKPKIMKIQIKNEEELFAILKNDNNQYSNLENIEFSDDFLSLLRFRLHIEGKTLDGNIINGHITSDLLEICSELQSLMSSVYAIAVTGKDDLRAIRSEREKVPVVFQINKGSLEIIATFEKILKELKNMSASQLIIIATTLCVISGGYFYESYQERKLEYDTKKLELQDKENERVRSSEEKLELLRSNNQLATLAMERFREHSYRHLKTSRLNLESASFANAKPISKADIEIINEKIDEDEDVEPKTEQYNLTVKKLYKKGVKQKNMATLANDNFEVEAELVHNLLEKNEKLLFDSFTKNTTIKGEVTTYEVNGKIKKAILHKIIE